MESAFVLFEVCGSSRKAGAAGFLKCETLLNPDLALECSSEGDVFVSNIRTARRLGSF